jgi:hypothetical protein
VYGTVFVSVSEQAATSAVLATWQRKARGLTMRSTEEILGNVIWLIDALDDDALAEVQDLPFVEMAKNITIAAVSSNARRSAPARQGDTSLYRRKENPAWPE